MSRIKAGVLLAFESNCSAREGPLFHLAETLLDEVPEATKITMIGHSMGTMIAAELAHLFPTLNYSDIVFLAAAASTRDFINTIPDVLGHQGGTGAAPVNFYNLSLHPRNEAGELTFYGALPSGSLLDWIDEAYTTPATKLDRTFGKWVNLKAADAYFARLDGVARSNPRTDDVQDVRCWRRTAAETRRFQ